MKRNYFFIVSLFILFFSIVGFSDNLFTDIHQKSNSDPKFIIHGLFCFAWMIFLVIQTYLARKANFKLHKQLGITGFLMAAGVIISSFYIFIIVFKGWSQMHDYVKANRIFMTLFIILMWLAYKKRNEAAKHKHYVFMGTFYILEPILSRCSDRFGMEPIPFLLVVWNLFFLSLFVYDWLVFRKIHPITYVGYIVFYLVWAFAIVTSA